MNTSEHLLDRSGSAERNRTGTEHRLAIFRAGTVDPVQRVVHGLSAVGDVIATNEIGHLGKLCCLGNRRIGGQPNRSSVSQLGTVREYSLSRIDNLVRQARGSKIGLCKQYLSRRNCIRDRYVAGSARNVVTASQIWVVATDGQGQFAISIAQIKYGLCANGDWDIPSKCDRNWPTSDGDRGRLSHCGRIGRCSDADNAILNCSRSRKLEGRIGCIQGTQLGQDRRRDSRVQHSHGVVVTLATSQDRWRGSHRENVFGSIGKVIKRVRV